MEPANSDRVVIPCQSQSNFQLLSGSAYSSKGCCGLPSHTQSEERTAGYGARPPCKTKSTSFVDTERGSVGVERAVLSIQGMTCVCCESTLQKCLAALPSVGNIKISLLLSQVQFDTDLALGSTTDVIRQIERSTGLRCERVTNGRESLDVTTDCAAMVFLDQPLPLGVSEMTVLEERTVRIYFDPKIVGARDLLETGFHAPLKLAPRQLPTSKAARGKHVHRLGYMTLLSAFMTIPVLVLAWAPLPERPLPYAIASLAMATVIQTVVMGPIYSNALKALVFSRVVGMDFLVSLSTTAAYTFSVVTFVYEANGRPLPLGSFYATSTLLVTLIMLGRYVSALSCQRALDCVSIRSLQIPKVALVSPDHDEDKEMDARLLQYGDTFKVGPGLQVPTDGTVISGVSEVDESVITGESCPVEKLVGSTVIAGSRNGQGELIVRVSRLPYENTVSTLVGVMEELKLSKPKIQELADRVAYYFVFVIVALTGLTFTVWIAVGVKVQHLTSAGAATQAAMYAITVLVVSCPCAIGLAVPMVVAIAGEMAAKHGIVFKSSEALESAGKVSHVVFDKTGTLTEGKMSVCTEKYMNRFDGSTRSFVLGLVSAFNHPVSSAIAVHLKRHGVQPMEISEIKSITGSGVEGQFGGRFIRAGNARWLGVESDPVVMCLRAQNLTVCCVVIEGTLAAVFGLEDSLRQDALRVITSIASRGISVSIISGDDNGTVQSIATRLGITASNAKSCCSPYDKKDFIRRILDAKAENKVLFCGDGTNDILALEEATVGVHMDNGMEMAQSAADIVLILPSLASIPLIMDMSRAARLRIRLNFAWAFLYNIFAIMLAAGAFVAARIPPEYAGLGELISVLPVVLTALQLRWVTFQDV